MTNGTNYERSDLWHSTKHHELLNQLCWKAAKLSLLDVYAGTGAGTLTSTSMSAYSPAMRVAGSEALFVSTTLPLIDTPSANLTGPFTCKQKVSSDNHPVFICVASTTTTTTTAHRFLHGPSSADS
jgi:hypothetical protein